jgi:hypothetical protein
MMKAEAKLPRWNWLTEEKKPRVDRLFVDKKDKEDFDRLKEKDTPFAGVRDHEIFVAAMVTGYHEGCKIELKNRKEFFFEKDLTKEESALIKAIAVADTGGLDVLLDKQKVYSIAEQYATGGIALLKNKAMSGEYGSYAKKLESDLLKAHDQIVKDRQELTPSPELVLEKMSISDLISKPESEMVEFKASMLWDINKQQYSKELKIVIARVVASFMNSKGGILIIGVGDDKTILGLEKDLARLHDSPDQFELTFTDMINTYLGKSRRPLVDLKFEKVEDKLIAIVRVAKSPRPVFVRYDNEEDFCIREGNSTQTLGVSEANEYIKDNWPDLR